VAYIENIRDKFSYGTLRGVAVIDHVVDLAVGVIAGRHEPDRAAQVRHVNGVQAKVLVPQQLHHLAHVLIHSAHHQSWG